MNTDVELDIWREQWQADVAVPENLRRSAERQPRLMKLGLISDAVVTVVMGGGSAAWAVHSAGSGCSASRCCHLAFLWPSRGHFVLSSEPRAVGAICAECGCICGPFDPSLRVHH